MKKATAKPAAKRPNKKEQEENANGPKEDDKKTPKSDKGDKGDKGDKPRRKNKNWEWVDPCPNIYKHYTLS